MKKVLAGIFLAASLVSFSDELVIRGGFDFVNDYSGMSDFITGDSGDDSLGYELGVEYLKNVSPNFLIEKNGHIRPFAKGVLQYV